MWWALCRGCWATQRLRGRLEVRRVTTQGHSAITSILLWCCYCWQRGPSSLQTAAKSHTYFKRALPLIPPVLVQLAIDDNGECSSWSNRRRRDRIEVLWFSATEHLLLSACSLGPISRRGGDTWVNSPSFEAADPGQPVILAAGQSLAFPSSLSLSLCLHLPSRFPNSASPSAGRVFCYLYEA